MRYLALGIRAALGLPSGRKVVTVMPLATFLSSQYGEEYSETCPELLGQDSVFYVAQSVDTWLN